jgi:lysyl-tRNA synthetase class 2
MNTPALSKSSAPRIISFLLVIQSVSIVGLFSSHQFPHIVHVIGSELQTSITRTTEAGTVIISVALLLIARGISLRRKRAWQLAVILQSLLIFIALFHNAHRFLSHHHSSKIFFGNFGLTHLLFELGVLVALLFNRRFFNTVTNPHTRKSDLFYFLQVSGLSALVSLIIVYFDRDKFVHNLSSLEIFETSIKGLVGVSGPVAFAYPKSQERIENLLLGLGLFIAFTTIVRALRPLEHFSSLGVENKNAIKDLISRYPSDDSLAYFAIRDDKDVVWAKNRKAAIAYSVMNGTMIASGDPLGDPECWPAAIEAFIQESERHGWVPAVYGCTEKAGEIWQRETGCSALEIGDEAIVLISDFNLETPRYRNVRQMVNKAHKAGYETHTKKVSELTDDERLVLSELAQKWRKGRVERGFSMALGRFCDIQDPDAVITWASVDGVHKALLQFVPWGNDGLSLDLMRREESNVSGVNELLIAATIEYAGLNGIKKISLNFATFRSVLEKGNKLGAGPITRLNYRLIMLLSRFVQIESLFRFNAKFQPMWETRYILFPRISYLGKVAIAILRLESFLPSRSKRQKIESNA